MSYSPSKRRRYSRDDYERSYRDEYGRSERRRESYARDENYRERKRRLSDDEREPRCAEKDEDSDHGYYGRPSYSYRRMYSRSSSYERRRSESPDYGYYRRNRRQRRPDDYYDEDDYYYRDRREVDEENRRSTRDVERNASPVPRIPRRDVSSRRENNGSIVRGSVERERKGHESFRVNAWDKKRERVPELDEPAKPNESHWEHRQRIREQRTCSPLWARSPTPPRRLDDRLEIGADKRKRKERRRKRKEEKRAKREAKRLRLAEEERKRFESEKQDVTETETNAKPALAASPPKSQDSDEEDTNAIIGPAPLPTKGKSGDLDYGKALMPGEGTKLAAYVQEGARIPRRGEIGLSTEQIEDFEKQGYVMSGSRNVRMEAVRIRKENQVYSAEELAALSQLSREERELRDERMMNRMRIMVEAKYAREQAEKRMRKERSRREQS